MSIITILRANWSILAGVMDLSNVIILARQNQSRTISFHMFWQLAMKLYDDLTYPQWVDSLIKNNGNFNQRLWLGSGLGNLV